MKVFNLFRGQYGYNYRMMQIQEIGDHPDKAVDRKAAASDRVFEVVWDKCGIGRVSSVAINAICLEKEVT